MATEPTMTAPKAVWETSFQEQIARGAYNTAPVEALARSASYYLRERYEGKDLSKLHFLEMGCGAGPNLIWLAQKGIRVSGIDISSQAVELCQKNFEHAGLSNKVEQIVEGSVDDVPFPDASFDGIFESCVFQHLDKTTREKTFAEVRRLLKPGGLFVGYMLDAGHTVFQKRQKDQDPNDPGTLVLREGGSNIYLTNIGVSHFFRKEEYNELLKGFSVIDPCLATYELPRSEAEKRGYPHYRQSMWIVYAIK